MRLTLLHVLRMGHSAFKLALLASLLSRNNDEPARELVSRAKQLLEAAEDISLEGDLGDLITFAELAKRHLVPSSTVSQTLPVSERKRPEYIDSVKGVQKAVSAFFEAVLNSAEDQYGNRPQAADWLKAVKSELGKFREKRFIPRLALKHLEQFQLDRRANRQSKLVGVAEKITGIAPPFRRKITLS